MKRRTDTTLCTIATVAAMALALPPAADATIRTAGSGSARGWGSGHLAAQQTRQTREERLFLQARSLVNQTRWADAARQFKDLRDEFPRGRHASDSFYWEAFARHRLGEREQAVLLLANMLEQVPDTVAADGVDFRRVNDARQLRLRILGEMAEEGDPRAAQEVLTQSEAAIGTRWHMQSEATRYTLEPELNQAVDTVEADSVEATRADAGPPAVAGRIGLSLDGMAMLADGRVIIGDGTKVYCSSLEKCFLLLANGGLAQRQLPEHCDEASVQQEALTALMRLEMGRIEILRGVIARDDECAANLRTYAVERLAREETEEALQELIALTAGHPDADTRRRAVRGLRRFDAQAAVDALAAALAQSDDAATQAAAIQALRHNESSGALAALEAYAADASRPDNLRVDAIDALGRRTEVEADDLIRLYSALDADELKSALIGRLRRIAEEGNEQAERWLHDLTLDASESVDIRSEALDAWSRSPSLPVSAFAEAYGRLGEASEPKLRERIFYALYRMADRSSDATVKNHAVTNMVELARVESDPEVRERAVYWLGRTGSPEAIEFLLELLRRPPLNPSPRNG